MNSSGEVNIVLVFSINEKNNEILIEQWEMALPEDHADTRSESENATRFPKCISTFNLTLANPPELAVVVPADPSESDVIPEGIRLGFEKVFARMPREGSAEKDLMFTPPELTDWWMRL